MRRVLGRLSLVVCVVTGMAACGTTSPVAGGQRSGASRLGSVDAAGRLSEALQLSLTRTVGGPPISGALVVSNPGATINLNPHGCRPQFAVVLTNSEFPPLVAWPANCEVGPFLIPHGTTRLPISVPTTYRGCLQPGGSGWGLPRCSASGPPPLPQGAYTAVLEWEGTVPLPPARPVAVTILAS